MEVEHIPDEQGHKKGRHRKKQLYNSILQQMEFYFSDSNLTKDRFLSQLVNDDPYIDISIFLKFNKIRKLTTNVDDIVKAVGKSELLELSEDKTKVRRKLPVQNKENVDECTVYVERLKSDATHEWLTSIFSEFGSVVYVSIPKYKHNGMIKGFAFIEFENEEGAKAAVDYFESIDCKIPSHLEPEHLCSIATYEGDSKNIPSNKIINEELKENDETTEESKNQVKEIVANKDSDDSKEKKKRKHSNTSVNENDSEKRKAKTDNEDVELQNAEQVEAMSEEEVEGSEKKRKKHKKAHRKKMNLKEIGLQILSKKDWKKMRNRYLDMQKKTMKQLKMHLNRQRFSKRYETNKSFQRKEDIKIDDKNENGQENDTNKQETDLIPGTIVKVSLLEPCEENKKLKTEIKSFSPEVKYVDIPLPLGSQEVFVRFADSKTAQTFCASSFNKGKLSLLEGDEEKDYWKKIEIARQTKQKRTGGKQRGRDKLLKKAEKQVATHVRFDNNDSE